MYLSIKDVGNVIVIKVWVVVFTNRCPQFVTDSHLFFGEKDNLTGQAGNVRLPQRNYERSILSIWD